MLKRGHIRVIGRKIVYALLHDTVSSGRVTAASEWEASRQAHRNQVVATTEKQQVLSTELLHRVRNDLHLIHITRPASPEPAIPGLRSAQPADREAAPSSRSKNQQGNNPDLRAP